MTPIKLLLRVGKRLQAAWLVRSAQARHDEEHVLELLSERHRDLQRAQRKLQYARSRNLSETLPGLREELTGLLRLVQDNALSARLKLEEPEPSVPEIGTLVNELQELEAEFGNIEISWTAKNLTVTTEPIILEGVALGPFAIRLRWQELSHIPSSECFDIVALDPNPSATSEDVTHPHVRDQTLCPGDAAKPLRLALEQGRIADAFLLVRNVLRNYNPKSPHVALDVWGGTECQDCGSMIRSGDECYCADCDQDYCPDCIDNCPNCDTSCCAGCMFECCACQVHCCGRYLKKSAVSYKSCCPTCFKRCAACEAGVTDKELTPGTQRCAKCTAQQTATQPDVPPPEVVLSTDPLPPSENIHEAIAACATPTTG